MVIVMICFFVEIVVVDLVDFILVVGVVYGDCGYVVKEFLVNGEIYGVGFVVVFRIVGVVQVENGIFV